jgi:transposase-like protein
MKFTKEQTEELLSKFLAEKDGLHTVLEMMLNSMMLIERKVFLEDSPENKGNGYRPLRAFGHGHEFELRIPRDRFSQFSPVILAMIREQEKYLNEVSFKLYSKGLTTRDISDVMETIYGGKYSKSKISNISQSFYEEMAAWRNRSLDKHYLAFYIDGLHVKLKRDKRYENECFYVILGLKEDCTREIISIVNFPQESASAWELIFDDIKQRGVESVGIIVSDALTSIDKSISKKFNTAHQKCTVHLIRNLMNHVRSSDKKELIQDIKEILDPDNQLNNIELALDKFEEFKSKWSKRNSSFGRYLDNLDIAPYLTFLNYDVKVRKMLYTTNWIERFNKSARRTLKIRGAFPNEESVLALITSAAMEMTDNHYKYPIYNFKNEDKLQSPSILKAKQISNFH